jgi:hypothetical protein
MARRLGTQTKPSWAITHIHVAYLDRELRKAYDKSTLAVESHELVCAATANLMAYLGWFRGTELFNAEANELTIIPPVDGRIHGLPPNLGAVLLNLLMETKSNPCQVANLVMAYETLSGLQLGFWVTEIRRYNPTMTGFLFSTARQPKWTSRYFRETYAWPLLEQMRTVEKEPSLQIFSNEEGSRIYDNFYSMQSWRRGGRSKVSRTARHNEPKVKGTRKATEKEIYEHGRWAHRRDETCENMTATYNQWGLVERLAITLLCM